MIEILIMILIIITIINVVCLVEINNKIQKLIQTPNNNDKKVKREHSSISQAKFDNILQGRENYKKYKNQDGLYEPVKPKNGIEIKPRKEE